jgi:hypothetical protein
MTWNEAKSGRLIRKAADVMKDKGYLKGGLGDPEIGFCVRGATNYAWCGNAQVTQNFEYDDTMLISPGAKRNPQILHALTVFGLFLQENDLVPGTHCVEAFNDRNEADEVIRWMHKFADEVDPKK